ncbi:uncharacterized protein MYCFIDRAFT_178997 [Pseudocercospora fijiensis CIRAD86]|uniref:Uncharacterized protein n=1 Tax=Pseudocercospora fijiensis (strain CIRAD86) TaxID=383855 RepID=M2YME8_PSEFD|nr:uncharacterized protein MYCFIDRAFT_178997 [Pseudocercospora fijiensis CIRAD86]EME78915.1 hypothetical protein MYCFIDRAFT_178997 [Pseudocercospora fijiensis CIRAD86]
MKSTTDLSREEKDYQALLCSSGASESSTPLSQWENQTELHCMTPSRVDGNTKHYLPSGNPTQGSAVMFAYQCFYKPPPFIGRWRTPANKSVVFIRITTHSFLLSFMQFFVPLLAITGIAAALPNGGGEPAYGNGYSKPDCITKSTCSAVYHTKTKTVPYQHTKTLTVTKYTPFSYTSEEKQYITLTDFGDLNGPLMLTRADFPQLCHGPPPSPSQSSTLMWSARPTTPPTTRPPASLPRLKATSLTATQTHIDFHIDRARLKPCPVTTTSVCTESSTTVCTETSKECHPYTTCASSEKGYPTHEPKYEPKPQYGDEGTKTRSWLMTEVGPKRLLRDW